MNVKFAERAADAKVSHDLTVLADFIAIWCEGHHKERQRHPAHTDASLLGVYESRQPALCDECEAHLAYAEKRRAYCPKDPKPFCAHCDTHCYQTQEREWQRDMMRYSGPKSWKHGHAMDSIRHALEGIAHKREMKKQTTAADDGRS